MFLNDPSSRFSTWTWSLWIFAVFSTIPSFADAICWVKNRCHSASENVIALSASSCLRRLPIRSASLLIGSTVLGRGGIFLRAVGAVLGAIIFRLVYTIALRLDMPAFMLKLVSAVIVVLAISVPYLKTQLPVIRRRIQRKAD